MIHLSIVKLGLIEAVAPIEEPFADGQNVRGLLITVKSNQVSEHFLVLVALNKGASSQFRGEFKGGDITFVSTPHSKQRLV